MKGVCVGNYSGFFADFATPIVFYDLNNQLDLPVNEEINMILILKLIPSDRSSANIRRVVVAISAIYLLNFLIDSAKVLEVCIAINCMHSSLQGVSDQASDILQNSVSMLSANLGKAIRSLQMHYYYNRPGTRPTFVAC